VPPAQKFQVLKPTPAPFFKLGAFPYYFQPSRLVFEETLQFYWYRTFLCHDHPFLQHDPFLMKPLILLPALVFFWVLRSFPLLAQEAPEVLVTASYENAPLAQVLHQLQDTYKITFFINRNGSQTKLSPPPF
jgi:hypothetical protein